MSGVFEGQWTQSSPANIPGDLYIGGDITVVGSINTGGSGEGQIVDAINTVNYGETGAGVGGAGISGIEVDRGTETNFRFIFDESDDKFKSGLIGSMKVVTHGDVGTQGYIPFGITGGGQLTESSNLFWDSANNRLGVNTTSPASVLHVREDVSGQIVTSKIQNAFGANGTGVEYYLEVAGATASVQGIIAGTNETEGLDLVFATSAAVGAPTEAMRIDSVGNVGINQASPSEKLDMLGNARVDGNIIVTGTVDGVDVAAHKTSYDAHVADSSIHFTEAAIDHTNILNIGTNTHAQIDTAITNSTNHIADSSIHFTVASIDHGSIAGLGDDDHTQYALVTGARAFTGGVTVNTGGVSVTGNSGFGIAAASAFGNLHVRSGVSGVASANLAADDFIVEGSGDTGVSILSPATNEGYIVFGNPTDDDAGVIFYNHTTDSMHLAVNGLGAVVNIDNTGDVGIGVASPAERLDVSGNIAVSGTVDGVDVSAHAADSTIHFTQASIDHTAILNIGTNTHAQIDTAITNSTNHIADSSIHFTVASIDHGSIAGLGDDDHTQYALADGTRAFTDAVTIGNGTGLNPATNTDTAIVLQGNYGGGIKFEDTNNAGIWVDTSAAKMHFAVNGTTSFGSGVFHIETTEVRSDLAFKVSTASSGVTPEVSADDLFIEGNTDSGITIGSGTVNTGKLNFARSTDNDAGQISFNHNTGTMGFRVEGSERYSVTNALFKTVIPMEVSVNNSAVTPSGDADDLFVENSGNSGITIGSGTTSTGNLFFGDSGDNDIGSIVYDHNTDELFFKAGASTDLEFKIDSSGYYVETSNVSDTGCHSRASHATYTGATHAIQNIRTANAGFNFLICDSDYAGTIDQEFRLQGDGNGYAELTWNNSGADYAEYFESVDGNSIPYGTSVILVEDKVRIAEEGEDPDGVISACPSVIGNDGTLKWAGKYLKTPFGNFDLDENGDRKLNPDFDESVEYVPRSQRDEWNVVGLLGQIVVLKGQPVSSRWKKMKDVDENTELWLVR